MKSSRLSWLWAVAAAVVLAGPAFAAPAGDAGAAPGGARGAGGRGGAGGAGGRGGAAPMTKEQTDAVWGLQAKCVAMDLALAEEPAGKMTEAYKAARQSQMDAAAKMREDMMAEMGAGGDRGAMMTQMAEKTSAMNKEEVAKLEAALKGILSEEQLPKAMASLGTFNSSWDRMVLTLNDFKLEEPKLMEGLAAVNAYVIDVAKAEKAAAEAGDPASAAAATAEAKTKLDEKIATLVSEEQKATWDQATRTRGGRGGAGGGGRGGAGGAGARGGNAPAGGAPAAGAPAAGAPAAGE